MLYQLIILVTLTTQNTYQVIEEELVYQKIQHYLANLELHRI